jgi:hypothetical protein
MTFRINEGKVISFLLKGRIGILKEGLQKRNEIKIFFPLLGILSSSCTKIAKKIILKIPTNKNV